MDAANINPVPREPLREVGALIFKETSFVAIPSPVLDVTFGVGDIEVAAHNNVASSFAGVDPQSGETCCHRIQKAVLLDLTTGPRLTGVDIHRHHGDGPQGCLDCGLDPATGVSKLGLTNTYARLTEFTG